ncbi:hypothetical protein ABPG74_004308 [Tetrahymena malaccensis]
MQFQGEAINYTYQNLVQEEPYNQIDNMPHVPQQVQDGYKRFFSEFLLKNQKVYIEKMKQAVESRKKCFELDLEDLQSYNADHYQLLIQKPNDYLPLLEKAASEAFYTITNNRSNFQVFLVSTQDPKNLRDIKASSIQRLITVSGIITQATRPYIRSKILYVECSKCHHQLSLEVSQGLGSVSIPPFCKNPNQGNEKCPKDSYVIIPEKCTLIDQQRMKLQESPEDIPTGEIPRTFSLCAERYLVNRLAPGTRVVLTGIYQVLEKTSISNKTLNSTSSKINYIQVVGYKLEDEIKKKSRSFTNEEEEAFQALSKDPKIIEKIGQSIAPAIFGYDDIKQAIACLLFGGSKKILQDGIRLRGDINVLLIGDPSTGKSQFLKFVQRIAPNAVYTSGKGSSASGLTASITRDPVSGEFQIEGGAMVLADGGVVCIDEFDKMRPEDRVAIHEAMEQQTISIAKAGITTRLNSRCSVLAAANPIFGSYNDLKTIEDQIELQTTILSRFDTIFIVRDPKTVEHDQRLAEHVLSLHMMNNQKNGGSINAAVMEQEMLEQRGTEIELNLLRKYISYARAKIHPRLSERSAQKIQNLYVEDRKQSNQGHSSKKHHIPITVRQLEAIIRLSESIAKIQLSEEVTDEHINKAHELFQNSTMNAIQNGKELGLELPQELQSLCFKIEESIRHTIPVNGRYDFTKIKDKLFSKFNNARAIDYAFHKMIKDGELQQVEVNKFIVRKK